MKRFRRNPSGLVRQGVRLVATTPESERTSAEVVGKIMYLRQAYDFEPHKISMSLKRYQQV